LTSLEIRFINLNILADFNTIDSMLLTKDERHGHRKRIFAFLGEFVYGQLQDGAKAKKLIAKSLGTLCRRHFLRNQQMQGWYDQVYL
jgi:hypothetical protein